MSENLKPQRKSTDQDVLNSLGNERFIGNGADSSVSRITTDKGADSVLKKYWYENFVTKTPDEQKKLLERYYEYTEKISQFVDLNKNPLNQTIKVKEGDKKVSYNLEYQIILQGAIIFKMGGFRSSFGQPFISGINLYEKIDKSTNEEKIFLSTLDHLIKNFFSFLEKNFKFNFRYSSCNVKFDINQEEKKVTVKIMDLASSITDMKSSVISSE